MVRVMSNLFCTLMSCCGDQDSLAPLDPVRSASATMANKERRGLSAVSTSNGVNLELPTFYILFCIISFKLASRSVPGDPRL